MGNSEPRLCNLIGRFEPHSKFMYGAGGGTLNCKAPAQMRKHAGHPGSCLYHFYCLYSVGYYIRVWVGI